MPPGWTKLGLEPGQAGRQVAESRNVRVIAHSLESTSSCKADAIALVADRHCRHNEDGLNLTLPVATCSRSYRWPVARSGVFDERALEESNSIPEAASHLVFCQSPRQGVLWIYEFGSLALDSFA